MTRFSALDMQIKITQDVLDQLRFEAVPIGLDARGKLVTEPNHRAADYLVRDSELKGFGVRVSKNAISFFVQRKMGGSTSVKRALGIYRKELHTVTEARKRAGIWLGLMRSGVDPLLEITEQKERTDAAKARQKRTFGLVFDAYMEERKSQVAPKTYKDWVQVQRWMLDTELWRTPFDKVTPEIVARSLAYWYAPNPEFDREDPVKAQLSPYLRDISSGNKIYRTLCAAYNHAALSDVNGLLDKRATPFSIYRRRNPLPQARARTTVLPTTKTSGEKWLKALGTLHADPALTVNVAADYLLCVLLWGGRRTETQKLTWDCVDFEEKSVTFRGTLTKNKVEHVFPLTPFIAELLRQRREKNLLPRGSVVATAREPEHWVFPSRQRGKHIVDVRSLLDRCNAASGLRVGLHDLRRTFGTELARDTAGDVAMVKVAMNHAQARDDVTLRHYIQEKVELLRPLYEARERRLMRLAGLMEEPEVPEPAPPGPIASIGPEQIQNILKDPALREQLLRALLTPQS